MTTVARVREGALDRVAEHIEAELLDLHGVGPKAVRILRAALAAEGKELRAG